MSVGKVIELIGGSDKSWEDAVQTAVKRSGKTIRGIRGVEVVRMTGLVKNDKLVEYRVTVKISFGVEEKV